MEITPNTTFVLFKVSPSDFLEGGGRLHKFKI